MATRPVRVELNRAELDQVTLAEAEGLADLAWDIIELAAENGPDATPYGVGISTGGGMVAYANGKQIDTRTQEGGPGRRGKGRADTPRSVRGTSRGQLVVAAGFRFPAHLQEFGTIHHPAQPFLSPALSQRVPNAAPYIADAVKRRRAGRP